MMMYLFMKIVTNNADNVYEQQLNTNILNYFKGKGYLTSYYLRIITYDFYYCQSGK